MHMYVRVQAKGHAQRTQKKIDRTSCKLLRGGVHLRNRRCTNRATKQTQTTTHLRQTHRTGIRGAGIRYVNISHRKVNDE
jgi:hypothetical protein